MFCAASIKITKETLSYNLNFLRVQVELFRFFLSNDCTALAYLSTRVSFVCGFFLFRFSFASRLRLGLGVADCHVNVPLFALFIHKCYRGFAFMHLNYCQLCLLIANSRAACGKIYRTKR